MLGVERDEGASGRDHSQHGGGQARLVGQEHGHGTGRRLHGGVQRSRDPFDQRGEFAIAEADLRILDRQARGVPMGDLVKAIENGSVQGRNGNRLERPGDGAAVVDRQAMGENHASAQSSSRSPGRGSTTPKSRSRKRQKWPRRTSSGKAPWPS